MPNRTELMHAPKDRRGGYLQKALWQGQMAFAILLFAYCVEAFKRKPTKRKSIYIWNTFLRIQFDPTIAADDPFTDLTIECDQELLNNAKDWIDTAIRMRQSAEQMNRLVRFFSTSDREVPPTMFDTIIAGMIAKTGDSPLGDLVRQSDRITGFGSLDIKASMINHNFLDTVKQGLRDAGFDLAEVGVSSVRM